MCAPAPVRTDKIKTNVNKNNNKNNKTTDSSNSLISTSGDGGNGIDNSINTTQLEGLESIERRIPPAVSKLSIAARTLLGRAVKRLLDIGRLLALDTELNQSGLYPLTQPNLDSTLTCNITARKWTVLLVPYIHPSLTLENTVLMALPL